MNTAINLSEVIIYARDFIEQKKYGECEDLIKKAMAENPHSAVPHNLFGILLKKKQLHSMAMTHFRAAWALDPTYLPSRHNLEILTSFENKRLPVYSEEELVDNVSKKGCKSAHVSNRQM